MPALTVRPYQATAGLSLIEKGLGASTADSAADDISSIFSSTGQQYVCVGDVIDTNAEDGFLRGHGTHVVDGQLLATVCGVVQRVNKLVSVQPLNSRYKAQQGDVVVGRVTEVSGKRWRIDISASQDAHLLLSAVNLPGGIQRRRNAEDELNMRELFKEGDLISAEVQSVHGDGSIALHTRSFKYGKLVGGQLLTVPHNLVKRQKQHFTTLAAQGVDLILGVNGQLWVAPSWDKPQDEGLTQLSMPSFTQKQCASACRVACAIRALSRLYMSVYPAAIVAAYEASTAQSISSSAMLELPFLELLVQARAAAMAH